MSTIWLSTHGVDLPPEAAGAHAGQGDPLPAVQEARPRAAAAANPDTAAPAAASGHDDTAVGGCLRGAGGCGRDALGPDDGAAY